MAKNVNARVYVRHDEARKYLVQSLVSKAWYKPSEHNDLNTLTLFQNMEMVSTPAPQSVTMMKYDFLGHYYIAALPDMN